MRVRSERLRAVFDCNTCVQALAYEGPAAACFSLFDDGVVELFVSRAILAELREVFSYPRVLAISPRLTTSRIGAFQKRLSFRATRIHRVPQVFDYPRDPNDEPYIDLALAARADYIVTSDTDLLDLMTGHSQICKQFRHMAPFLRIVDPVEFLRVARGRS